jgi:CHAT domain-containing protein
VESLLRLKAPPALLLFATHGFFLPEASCGFQAVSLNLEPSAALPACEGGWENPLNRSVLALAGSNRWRPDNSQFYWDGKKLISLSEARDLNVDPKALEAHTLIVPDGILTAYQVTGLNLFGTELVSLTACETGTGEVTRDGVAGLREAIFLAGARSVVMSLWEIPVTEARDQMTAFYSNWQSGQASSADRRLEAFHKAQVAELNRQRTQRGAAVPFYWAASIYAGDPGDLPRVSAPAQK